MHKRLLCVAALAWFTPAFAQVTPIATESFDYAYPNNLGGLNGGAGWAGPWESGPSGNYKEIMANPPTHPGNPMPWPQADAVGHYIRSISPGPSFRLLDLAAHPELIAPGTTGWGADGTTIWISYSTWITEHPSPPSPTSLYFSGVSLFQGLTVEPLFLGKPQPSPAWGIAQLGGGWIEEIPNSDVFSSARLVARIDFQTGEERLRVWLNPSVEYPIHGADIDTTLFDLTFDRIRVTTDNSSAYWDDLEIAKGAPIGETFCTSAPNSTGLASFLTASGSLSVAANDLTLTAHEVPVGEMGFFLGSLVAANIPNPGGFDGTLCLGSHRARFVDLIGQAGADGRISALIPLDDIPANPSVAAMAGDTYHWQLFYRDTASPGGANFSHAIQTVLTQ